MFINILNSFVKSFFLNTGAAYAFIRITNYNKDISKIKMLILMLGGILFTSIECLLKYNFTVLYSVIFILACFSCSFAFLIKCKLSYSILVTIISYSISYTCSLISTLIIALVFFKIYYPITNYNSIHPLPVILVSLLNYILVFTFFKTKKFKNGFSFINKYSNNEYFSILMLIISSIIIFMYVLCAEINAYTPIHILAFFLIFFALILILIIQKTFTLYHKHKLQSRTLKDYEHELNDIKRKLEIAVNEKDQIVKSNHEFYHRQEALNKKLDIILSKKAFMDTEFGEDYADLKPRIEKMSKEYKSKVSFTPNLEKTNLPEIDDMFIYMQSECNKYNIEFNIKINYDLNDIIDKYITSSQLETLLGDLIRNSVIAINHSSFEYKSILVVFGVKDNFYEISFWDSGIPFEINTLINLGIKPASTHLDEGGTGIGFITTFETLESCNASLILNEITNNNYTKCLSIRFDNTNNYVISSDRIEMIKQSNTTGRKIILKK